MSGLNQRPDLRQFRNLSGQDLDAHPIWVSCHIVDYDEPWYDGTDESTFRPWTGELPVDAEEAEFLIKVSFTHSDGTRAGGCVVAQRLSEGPDIRSMQPVMFLSKGVQVGFWVSTFREQIDGEENS